MKLLKNFPYFSQLDNKFNPYGSCNVTSIAMCLWYWGIRGDGSQAQLEDQLYQKLLDKGLSRHDPDDLRYIAESYPGVTDDFVTSGTIADITTAIDKGLPCVLHGYFTRSGHIITVVGYNDNGLIVNDPYGEYFPGGYDTGVDGHELTYSYDLIARVCSPESISYPKDIWLHRISRK